MLNNLQNPLSLLARLFLAALFVMSGFNKITGFDMTVGYIASKHLPLPALGAVIAILCELGGGLLIVFGFYTRVVALVLAVFTIVAAIFFHAFWAVPPEQTQNMFIHFWKNVSIAGGFLMLAAFGPGGFSLDARRRA